MAFLELLGGLEILATVEVERPQPVVRLIVVRFQFNRPAVVFNGFIGHIEPVVDAGAAQESVWVARLQILHPAEVF